MFISYVYSLPVGNLKFNLKSNVSIRDILQPPDGSGFVDRKMSKHRHQYRQILNYVDIFEPD